MTKRPDHCSHVVEWYAEGAADFDRRLQRNATAQLLRSAQSCERKATSYAKKAGR